MTWTGTSNNMISNFDFAAGDYSSFESISITVSNLTNAGGIRLQIRANGKEKLVVLNGENTFTKNLIKDFGFTEDDLTSVEWVRVLGCNYGSIDNDHPASAVINDVYFYQPSKTLNVNLSAMDSSNDNATWNKDTKVFAWTLSYANSIVLPGLSGNLSSYKTINYETAAGTSDAFRILIYYNNGAAQTTYYASVGNKSVTFKDMGVSEENLAHISSINFAGAATASGDIILNSFSLEGPAVNRIEEVTVQEVPVGGKDINGMTGAGTIKWDVTYPKTLNTSDGWCGSIDNDNNSVDITNYDYLHFVVSNTSADANLGFRVFVSTEESSDNSTRVILYPHPIADVASVSDWTAVNYITEPGIYVVKISDYPLLRGFKTNNSWDNSNAHKGTITVSLAYVTKVSPANPVDNVVRVGEGALTDPHAVCFDVTKLEGSGMTLNATNPNALFIANEGELANANNVIVSDACAQLALTDGNPFKSPSAFRATAAPTYNRAFTASTMTTVCLPFALTAAEAETLGTFYQLSTFDGVDLHFTSVAAPLANTPYLVIPANAGISLSEKGKSIAATPASLDESIDDVEFIGTLAATAIPASDETNSYFAFDNGSLVKITSQAATLPAFRGYFKVTTSAINGNNARRLGVSFGNDATGISDATRLKDKGQMKNDIFDLQGRRVKTFKKGLYIVNGKKVIK